MNLCGIPAPCAIILSNIERDCGGDGRMITLKNDCILFLWVINSYCPSSVVNSNKM